MNLNELSAALEAKNIDPSAYSLGGPADCSETYVIRQRESGVIGKPSYWVTYYDERGLESGRREFVSEDEACRHFLEWVSSDTSTRLR
jgi:hypothetical protein